MIQKDKLVIGFIGVGNMGAAIIGGVIKAGFINKESVIVSDLSESLLNKAKKNYGIITTHDNKIVAEKADVLFLCVKPHIYPDVIREVANITKKGAIVVIIAAGQTLSTVTKQFNREDLKIVKTMPNTPALVNSGMTAVCPSNNLTKDEVILILDIMNTVGKTEILPESLFDAFTGIAGSAPAYAFMFIEAMSDAGVKYGLSREQAIKFSAQTLLGASKMLLETGKHPGQLKDEVTSPGGTTIAAVCTLEKEGFRHAIISGVSACVEKSEKMKT